MRKIKNKVRYYWKYLVNLLKKTYTFIKANTFIFISTLAIVLVLLFPFDFGSKYKLIYKDNILILLSLIVGSLSSILGIVVAIQLVAFEILRKTFSSFAFNEFFKSNTSKYLFIRYIFTISVAVINIILLKSNPSNQNYFLTYLTIIMFFYCLLILYPSTKKIIIYSKSKDKITQLVKKINAQSIREIEYFGPRAHMKKQMEVIENNPIFILSDVCLRSLNEEDRITSKLIISESGIKLIEMLKGSDKGQVAREYINTFFLLFRPSFEKAAKLKQDGIIITILNIVSQIYHICAVNRFHWVSMIELNEELEKFAITLINLKNIDLSRRIIWLIERAYLENINKNLPDERNIWTFNLDKKNEENPDTDDFLQWTEISTNLLYILNNITTYAIDSQSIEIIWTGLRSYIQIASEVSKSQLGDKMKFHIIQDCFYYTQSLLINAADLGLVKKSSLMIPFDALRMDRIIEPSKDYSKKALLVYGTTLIELAKKDQIPFFKLNDIGAIGRFCMNNLEKSPFIKESVIYIVNVLIKLYEIYNSRKDQERNKFLIEIYQQAESIRKWFKADSDKHRDFLNILDKKISTIKDKGRLVSPNNVVDNWPEII